jgi:cold shock CspA family protein
MKMKASSARFRWFSLRPFDRKLLRKLTDGMLVAKFDEKTGFGFILGDVRKEKITGRFVRKETISRSITDPQGESQTVQFVDFSITRFTLSTTSPHLELENPPRRLSELMTAFGDMLDNRIAIVPVEASCRRWLEALTLAGCAVRSTKIVTGSIAISDTVAVKATFSGTRDVQKEALAFLKGKKSDPVEIAGELGYNSETARFKLSANGILIFASTPPDELLAAVRRASAALLA